MGLEGRPERVKAAIVSGDVDKLKAFGRAAGKKSRIEATRRDAEKDMHQDSMQKMAEERQDDLLPEDE